MLTELLPICNAVVVRLTFDPTFAPDEKLPVLMVMKVLLTTAVPIVKLDGDRFAVKDEFDKVSNIELAFKLDVLLPIKTVDVLILTLAPTFAELVNSPIPTKTPVLLTTDAPTTRFKGVRLALDVEFDRLTNAFVTTELAVLLPINIEVFVKLTLAPTLAPTEKLPVPVKIDDELMNELTLELPILIDDVVDVRFARPDNTTTVLFTTKLDPIL